MSVPSPDCLAVVMHSTAWFLRVLSREYRPVYLFRRGRTGRYIRYLAAGKTLVRSSE